MIYSAQQVVVALLGLAAVGVEGACPFAAKSLMKEAQSKRESKGGCVTQRQDVPQTARGVQEEVWGSIIADQNSHGFMNVMKTGLKSGNITYLEMMGDYQNGDRAIDGADHEKITHGIGGHAKVHFEWNSNEYTGLFQQADYCIARVANAAKPSKSWVTPASYNPNMAIKCFRDQGMESGNMQTIWEIDGYDKLPGGNGENKDSCSYFDVPVSNHCGNRENISTVLKSTFIKSFQKVDDNSMWLGVSPFARATQEGVEVEEYNFPFAVVFEPVEGLTDVPCEWDDVMSQLRGVAGSFLGKPIYRVYGVKDPWADRSVAPALQLLGNLVLDSEFVSSMFGDTELYFRHMFFEDEMAALDARGDSKRSEAWHSYAADSEMVQQEGAAWYMPYL